MPVAVHQRSFVLTVSESKRLIARGVRRHPPVLNALSNGTIAIAKGTTNSYIVEELVGEGIHRPHYCTGTTTPHGATGLDIGDKLPDVVLRNGERVEGLSATDAVREMKAGDVFIKGANALNYELQQAGILIGHPTGGTIGAAIGSVIARRVHLLIPVGLEKSIPGDLSDVAYRLTQAPANGEGPTLWPIQGEIFTEIEALECLCGVQAELIGAGGIAGAEGSVRISVWGREDEVGRTEALMESVYGEPPFL